MNNLLFKSNFISLNLVKKRFKRKGKNRKLVFNWDFLLAKNIKISPQKRRLVKSVHGVLNIPFLKNKFDFEPLIIFRHPASIIQSHLKLGLTDGDQDVFKNIKLQQDFLIPFLTKIEKISDSLERMGMQVGLLGTRQNWPTPRRYPDRF